MKKERVKTFSFFGVKRKDHGGAVTANPCAVPSLAQAAPMGALSQCRRKLASQIIAANNGHEFFPGVMFFKSALAFLFELQIQGMAIFFMYAIGGLVVIIPTEEAPEAVLVAEIPAATAAVDMMQMQIVFASSDEAKFTGLHDGRGDFCFFLGFFHGGCLLSA